MTDGRRATALATNGMVASPHELATAAGLAALRDGGTALDAVIAANAVLTVVYPDQTSIGGDCFVIYHEAETGRLHGLNGSGRAPAAADPEALRAAGHEGMPQRGIDSVTVPGTIAAWETAASRFGRLGLDRLLAPAIGYARDGFPVSPALSQRLAASHALLWEHNALRSVFLSNGELPRPGERLRQPQLADTLELIARDGAEPFYRGAIAEAIVATAKGLGGCFTLDDLASHQCDWVEPLVTDYRGLTVAELPPNSQGMTALIELNLVEQTDLDTDWGSAEHLHPLIEAKKLAFSVRDTVLTDPTAVSADVDHLISKAFAGELWRDYDPSHAQAGAGSLVGDTVYVCAVDRDGNGASLIQSIYQSFGSCVVAEGTGVVLQNRGAYFSLDAGHPNCLAGGKRSAHTLMPAMLLREGELVGPIGTQGGDVQAQVHLQLITDLVDFAQEPQAAIDAPRWVSVGEGTAAVFLEDRFPAATYDGLAARGHDVRPVSTWEPTFGHAQMIVRDSERGVLHGGADPRADGLALGY
jgi:gamma-glutamyltranspeptidase/glutathione hydrolase